MVEVKYDYLEQVVSSIGAVGSLIGEALESKAIKIWKTELDKQDQDTGSYYAFRMLFRSTEGTRFYKFAEDFVFSSTATIPDDKKRGNAYGTYAQWTIEKGQGRTPLEKKFVDLWEAEVKNNPDFDFVDRANEAWGYSRDTRFNNTYLHEAAFNLARENGLPVVGNSIEQDTYDHALYCLGHTRTAPKQPPGPPPVLKKSKQHSMRAAQSDLTERQKTPRKPRKKIAKPAASDTAECD